MLILDKEPLYKGNNTPKVKDPVVYITEENEGFLFSLSESIEKNLSSYASDLLLNHPAIYIHVWRTKKDDNDGKWSIYVGETNDIISRTKEHWSAARLPKERRNSGNWQHFLIDHNLVGHPTVLFFGHELFQKSLTLDVENRLIDYSFALETTHTHNGRGNPQGSYYGDEYLDDIFNLIWSRLQEYNEKLFLTQADIVKSAIYKASPNHKLTDDQRKAKKIIIDRTKDAIVKGKYGQLIFIKGEAGTGKTVLTSSSFFEIVEENNPNTSRKISSVLIVNHDEQLTLYRNMANKLGHKENIIQKPVQFLNSHPVYDTASKTKEPNHDETMDVVFVDEAHLLWNQHDRAYSREYGPSQLDEIMKRSRVTVIMYDGNQILDKRQIPISKYMEKKEELAKQQGPNPEKGENNFFELNDQLRIKCSPETKNWIDNITKNLNIGVINLSESKDKIGYEIRIFDSLKELHEAIKEKSNQTEYKLSRVIATYDWKYSDTTPPTGKKYWQIEDNGYSIPWNNEYYRVEIRNKSKRKERNRLQKLDWAEKEYTIDEAGSTFTIQGFDLSFAGVVLGPSVCYDEASNKIYFDESKREGKKMKGNRDFSDGTSENVTNKISKNEMRVLMTRGTNGLYIYACNENLRKKFRECVKEMTYL